MARQAAELSVFAAALKDVGVMSTCWRSCKAVWPALMSPLNNGSLSEAVWPALVGVGVMRVPGWWESNRKFGQPIANRIQNGALGAQARLTLFRRASASRLTQARKRASLININIGSH